MISLVLDVVPHAQQLPQRFVADLLVVRNNDSSPADRLVSLQRHDIEMVLTGGSITLSSQEFANHLPRAILSRMQLINYDGLKYWVAFNVLSHLNETVRHLGGELAIAGRQLDGVRPFIDTKADSEKL